MICNDLCLFYFSIFIARETIILKYDKIKLNEYNISFKTYNKI